MPPESIKANGDTKIEITRHENGKIKSKIHYVETQRHGLERWWYESGQKWHEITWRKGEKHGMATWWHEIDPKEWKMPQKDGKSHGIETWCRGKSQKSWQEYYIAGKEYAWIEWHEDGSLIEAYFHKQQKDQGKSYQPMDKLVCL